VTKGAAEEIATGVWCWQRRPRGLRAGEFGVRTSYAVAVGRELLLLDPLVAGEDDPALAMLDDLVRARVRILVTMPFHARSSESLWRRYRKAKSRIYGHPDVATRLSDRTGFEPVLAGTLVAGCARFHAIGRPARSEQPIEIAAARALAIGDSIVEVGGGELRVWEAPVESERRQRWRTDDYLPTLERLATLDIEHVLVTHGEPAIGDGRKALRRALESDPWQRPKRARPNSSSR
jgi:hypothetical protein